MKIEWTSWFSAPMHSRLEVLGVTLFMMSLSMGSFCAIAILYFLCFGHLYAKIVCGTYLAFLWYDWNSNERGGRGAGVTWVRNLSIWKHFINYFPVDLIKTADLPNDRNYLICICPHGLLSFGVGANFGSNHSKWSTLFPGIRPKFVTQKQTTLMPIVREVLLSLGYASATERALKTLLTQSNDPNDEKNRDGYTSNGIALIAGGVREVYYAFPNNYKCALAKRRGFVRIALETGASLVPAISFGENDLYKEIDLSTGTGQGIIKYISETCKYPISKILNGRGFLQHNFGLLPMRHPINTVIGAPIHLEKISNPSIELINQTHELFCTRLIELFETHKCKYVKDFEHIRLHIV